MIRFPRSLAELPPLSEEAGHQTRAGGTDLMERRRLRLAPGPLLDLRDLTGLDTIHWDGGAARIGSTVRIAQLARDAPLRQAYPGLCAAAGALATPQIRAVATLGGNLLQANRCWYFRNPTHRCLKSGGDRCLARGGDHLYHACFDRGPCVSVHPSTLGMALLAYEAQVHAHGDPSRSIEALYGDGRDPRRDHQLPPGALLTHVELPAPLPREQAAYFRTTSRARSEWPLVEVLVRLQLEGDTIRFARVSMGGVAPVPLRLPAVEAALVGARDSDETLARAAALARDGAKPLPMTEYKVDLVEGTVLETLERARHATPTEEGQ
ncbi:MAG: FAD binding domain-containing protein [Myxococcota bacterium]